LEKFEHLVDYKRTRFLRARERGEGGEGQGERERERESLIQSR